MLTGKVICAFPGVGKSHALRSLNQRAVQLGLDKDTVIDHDTYGYDVDDDYPTRYLHDLKTYFDQGKQLLASTRMSVLDALEVAGLEFEIVYPVISNAEEYLNRYLSRGSSIASIRYLYGNWEQLIQRCQQSTAIKHTVLNPGEHFSDVVSLSKDGLITR